MCILTELIEDIYRRISEHATAVEEELTIVKLENSALALRLSELETKNNRIKDKI